MTSASPQSSAHRPVPGPARRTVVAAAGAAGLAAALTACGSDDGSSSVSSDGADAEAPGGSAGAGGTVLAKTADIPEGGGKIFTDQGVVVTQPTAGTFKAFSAKCPHRGCVVTAVTGGAITCPCHHSAFSVGDGSVRKGPATNPLPAARITVEGDAIRLG
ncbi:Rieske (2Fe-2S) protein [Streptomyces sp. NPDC005925]|uniref:Rieske (2Fe-2S) protein n=1 Tax=Streptomyces sp. NPDC005925 TaxID=3157172 RepID=UPI0034021B25